MKSRDVGRSSGFGGFAWLAASLASVPVVTFGQSAPDEAEEARLEEIVVTSSIIATPRRQIGTAVAVMSGADISLRGYSSIADALRTLPGIGVSNTGGTGKVTTLRIRGEENYRTLLMIDGVKAVDASAPQVAPSFDSLLATGDLDRVEVLRGPQGFIYGADAGGVVNMLTKAGEGDLSGRVGVERGAFDTRKTEAQLSGGGELGDYALSVTDLDTDGFNASTADGGADDDGAKNTTLHMRLGWNATENLRVQLVARDIDASSMYDGCFSVATFALVNDCLGTTKQTTYKVSAELHGTDRFQSLFGYSDVDIARVDFAEDARAFATHGQLSRLEYTGSYRPHESSTLVYGLDLQDERVTGDATLQRDQQAYYAEYQGKFGSSFYLSIGARYDDNDDFGTHTSERLSAAYLQDLGRGDFLKYRASYGTGFRAPSLFEIAYNRGPFSFPPASGVELDEETSRGADLGIEYDRVGGLRFEITYFDQTIDDAIYFDFVGFSGYLQARGASTSKGTEISVELPIGDHWQALANWTHNDAQTAASEPRLRRPENLGNVGMLYRAPSEKLRLVANLRLSRDTLDIGGVALDDYEVLDLSMRYAFSDKVELSARIENALDEVYSEVIGFNTPGRAGYAGVQIRF